MIPALVICAGILVVCSAIVLYVVDKAYSRELEYLMGDKKKKTKSGKKK